MKLVLVSLISACLRLFGIIYSGGFLSEALTKTPGPAAGLIGVLIFFKTALLVLNQSRAREQDKK